MNVRGIYKTSLIDFPGRLSTVIFSGGCNLRCKYCHNGDIVFNNSKLESYSNEEILDFLRKRKGLIEGLTVTGGEPTLAKNLIPFLENVKELSFYIKVDTNGLMPGVINQLLEKKLVDYVAVDVKTSSEKYSELTDCDVDFLKIIETIVILKKSNIDYEIRTTCVPAFLNLDDLHSIKQSIGFVKKYCLQQFTTNVPLIDKSLESVQPYPVSVLNEFLDFVKTFSEESELRGI